MVLAAGEGQRMGGVAKPLIRRNGQPLISHLVRSLQCAGTADIIVVHGRYGQEIKAALLEHVNVRFVAVDAGQTQSASLQQGLMQVQSTSSTIMVCLADQPLVDEIVLTELLTAFGRRLADQDMLVPWIHGIPGNPVVFNTDVAKELMSLGAGVSGKTWRQQHPHRVQKMQTDNQAYFLDLDTMLDFERQELANLQLELP